MKLSPHTWAIVLSLSASVSGAWAEAPARPRITISRQTTYITEPPGPDGMVDYQAAINAEYGRGATRENNAAVLLLEAFGPESIEEEYRQALTKKLGLRFGEGQKYFEPFDDFAQRSGVDWDRSWNMLVAARLAPWRAEKYPLVAQWLRENRAALDKIVEATRRPRYFVPWLAPDNGKSLLENAPCLTMQPQFCRQAAMALASRANLALAEGRFDDAWGDVQAVLRLGLLAGQGPTLIERLVARLAFTMGLQTAEQWATSGVLTAAQCRTILDGLAALGPAPSLVEPWDKAERLLALDFWLSASRDPKAFRFARNAVSIFDGGDAEQRVEFVKSVLSSPQAATMDWDQVLRLTNQRRDQLVSALRLSGYPQRRMALEGLSDQWGRRVKAMEKLWQEPPAPQPPASEPATSQPETPQSAMSQAATSQAATSEPAASQAATQAATSQGASRPASRPAPAVNAEQIFVASDLWNDASSAQGMLQLQASVEARRSLAVLAVAVAMHKAESGKLPEKLAELTPKYIPAVPKDPFDGKDLRYKRTADGYVLYSVGANLHDDGGQSGERNLDDIAVQSPPPKPLAEEDENNSPASDF